jgi:adenylate cyclase
MAVRVVDVLRQRDPQLLGRLTEIGIVRREWVDDPESGPMSTATPVEVVQRLLERSIEQRPSLLSSIGLSAIQALSASSDESGEVVGVTTRLAVAFTDLEGFTKFTSVNGDEAASTLLTEHNRIVGPIVRSRGGHIVKRLGDGLLLTFPEPEAAVLACLELIECEPAPLTMRAGIHVGEVVSTRDDVIGHVVNVAARVAEAAKGGLACTVDVRDAAAPSLEGRVVFGRARRRNFKGVGESIGVCKVTTA